MNKKLSIFAIVLIIAGLIGSIWSGFFSMPYFINKLQDFDKQVNKESIIYNKKIDFDELNINTNYVNTQIVKSDTDNVVIKTKGLYDNMKIEVNHKGNTLSIEEVNEDTGENSIKSIDDFTSKLLKEAFSNYTNTMIIYVPKDVNLKVSTSAGYLNIEDDIFLDEFSFTTNSGTISLPSEVKKLNKMTISSENSISFSLEELLGIKSVEIYCSDVYIESGKYNIDEIEKYIPEKLNISDNNLDEGNISIESNLPISKNLTIDAYKSEVNLNLPLERYNYKFDISTYNGISFNDYLKNKLSMEINEELIKDFKENINKDLENQYNVSITASYVNFN